MSKTVTIRFSNGKSEKVILGEEDTCFGAEPRGWGTECKILVLKNDGFYHCGDCGLVFKKPVLETKSKMALVPCRCGKLVNFVKMVWNDFFGYDCPESFYQCKECKRVYKSPNYGRLAPLRLQGSKAAKKHVQVHRIEKGEKAERDAEELKETLKKIPRAKRQKILKKFMASS